jgi:iron complex transport system ATP-binding protein
MSGMMSGATSWEVRLATLRYPGAERAALERVTLDVPAGECTAVIGPNGAGKSSLVQILLGTLRPTEGEVRYMGRAVGAWGRRALAREVGVVPQSEDVVFPLTVREMVAMGRYPHLGALQREGAADAAAVDAAMRRCDVLHLAGRSVGTLSGGERQRTRVARALAQEPRALVLDEPTAALDVKHEMTVFELARELCRQGVTVVVVTHHLNLAARYADRLVLLHEGRVAARGAPDEVLTAEIAERVYQWPIVIGRHPGPGPDAGAAQVIPLAGGAQP